MIDWRELESARVASGVTIYRPTWSCHHTSGERRSPDYNGIGLRRFIGNVAPKPAEHPWAGPSYEAQRRGKVAS